MKMLFGAALFCLSFAAFSASPVTSGTASGPRRAPKLQLAVKAADAGAYLVTATFLDYGSGEVVASPTVLVEAGKWAAIDLAATATAPSTHLAVSVAPNSKGVAYFSESRLSNGRTDTQSGTLAIAR